MPPKNNPRKLNKTGSNALQLNKADLQIVVDTRESMVSEHLINEAKACTRYQISIDTKQISTGDYAFIVDGKIVIIFERKRWSDLSASIKDGRMENHDKLEALRVSDKCDIIYIIEGRSRSASSKVGGITMRALQAKLDHLMFRDKVFINYTTGPFDTAQRLIELAVNYISLVRKGAAQNASNEPAAQNASNEPATQNTSSEPATQNTSSEPATQNASSEPDTAAQAQNAIDTLTKRQVRSDLSTYKSMMAQLPSVSYDTAELFIQNHIGLLDLFTLSDKLITIESLSKFKYASGVSIGPERAKKILSCRNWHSKKSIAGNKASIAIVSAVPGISAAKGAAIIQNMSVYQILSCLKDSDLANRLSQIQYSPASASNYTKPIGKKVAADLVRILTAGNRL